MSCLKELPSPHLDLWITIHMFKFNLDSSVSIQNNLNKAECLNCNWKMRPQANIEFAPVINFFFFYHKTMQNRRASFLKNYMYLCILSFKDVWRIFFCIEDDLHAVFNSSWFSLASLEALSLHFLWFLWHATPNLLVDLRHLFQFPVCWVKIMQTYLYRR